MHKITNKQYEEYQNLFDDKTKGRLLTPDGLRFICSACNYDPTEILNRLYQSKRMKDLFPDDTERLNHIFAKQVYGCAPTEIIYRICLRYIFGFNDEIHIEKNNIKLCDTLQFAKDGTLETELEKIFEFN